MTPTSLPALHDPRTRKVVAFYESLSVQTLVQVASVYADDGRFIDPFNDVTGQARIRRVLEHMFETLDAPRFDVTRAATEGDQSFLLWNFSFRRKGRSATLVIRGATHLHFAADGRVACHRDYWDPARELYEHLPGLGTVLRWLRRRLSARA